jgi:hypothetical protein
MCSYVISMACSVAHVALSKMQEIRNTGVHNDGKKTEIRGFLYYIYSSYTSLIFNSYRSELDQCTSTKVLLHGNSKALFINTIVNIEEYHLCDVMIVDVEVFSQPGIGWRTYKGLSGIATARVGSEIDRTHMWYEIRRISECSWLILQGSTRCQNKEI